MTAAGSAHSAAAADFDPRACLRLPDAVDTSTEHAVKRHLVGDHDGQPVYLLTESGRSIFCAHLASGSPWIAWPEDFVDAVRPYNNITPPNTIQNWQFHMINVLWRFQGFAFRRSDLSFIKDALFTAFQRHPHPEWFPRLSEDTDVIQHVNKSGQWGLSHHSGSLTMADGRTTTYYWLRRPVKYDPVCRKPRPADHEFQPVLPGCGCTTTQGASPALAPGLASERARIIDYLYQNWIGVPLSGWTLEGHRDPVNKDKGLVAQPVQFNRHSRSKWKFDENGMKECPTVEYLEAQLERFYPSAAEREALIRVLFGSLEPADQERILNDLFDDYA